MKQLLILFTLPIFFLCCEKDDFDADRNPDLVGTWQVTEQFVDPGDGSGEFIEIDSDRTYTFNANGTLVSNRDICSPFQETDEETISRGSYNITDNSITPELCDPPFAWEFELEGRTLTLRFSCFEGCALRLRKLE